MAVKTRTTTLKGHKIEVTQHLGRRSLRLKSRLIKLLAPSVGTAIQQKVKKGVKLLDQNIDLGKVGEAIMQLHDLDENAYEDLILEILVSTRFDGRELDAATFDDVFAGELSLMYHVVVFVLKVNYGDFFGPDGIGSRLLAEATKEKAGPIPSKSEGSSSD